MQRKHHPSRVAFRLSALAAGLLLAGTAWGQATVANGVLSIFTGPGDKDAKFVVGPAAGQVQVFGIPGIGDGTVYAGIRGITLSTGAGNDKLQFDIDSPQSLDLRIDTGSGSAETRVQWRVPQNIASAVGTLDVRSGAGETKTEVNIDSHAPDFRFGWNMAGGGGNKEVLAKLTYHPGSRNVFNDVTWNLGGGTHKVDFQVDSDAARYALRMNTGAAADVLAKVQSPNASESISVDLITPAPKTTVEVTSAANVLNLNLGGNYGPVTNEVVYAVTQTRAAAVTANVNVRGGVVTDKVDLKLIGESSRLSLGGSVVTGGGNDDVKVETDMIASSTLAIDVGAQDDVVEVVYKSPLFIPLPGLPRILGGDGNDSIIMMAERGFTGQSARVDCGPGIDRVRAFGVVLNCESMQ